MHTTFALGFTFAMKSVNCCAKHETARTKIDHLHRLLSASVIDSRSINCRRVNHFETGLFYAIYQEEIYIVRGKCYGWKKTSTVAIAIPKDETPQMMTIEMQIPKFFLPLFLPLLNRLCVYLSRSNAESLRVQLRSEERLEILNRGERKCITLKPFHDIRV